MSSNRKTSYDKYRKERDDFNKKLDECISRIEDVCPDQWAFILHYIERQSLMPELKRGEDDGTIIKTVMEKQGCNRIFFRLARIFK